MVLIVAILDSSNQIEPFLIHHFRIRADIRWLTANELQNISRVMDIPYCNDFRLSIATNLMRRCSD